MSADGEIAVDAGGDTGAAASDTATDDTSAATDGTEAGEGEGGESAASSTPKHKIKLFGKEREVSTEEALKMLDDDYDWDLHGAYGLPIMQDGKPVSRKFRQIVRDVQMGIGAAEAARRANEERAQMQKLREWGKTPENRAAFMRRELGVEDFDQWALERAGEAFKKRQHMIELAQKDPVAYEAALRADREEREKQFRESTDRFESTQKQESERQAREKQFYGTVTDHLGKVGVPFNARTKEMVNQLCEDYGAAGAELTFEALAEIVRDLWHEEIFGYLDSKDDDTALKILGDKRRERFRKAEIAVLKGNKKAAAVAAPPKPANDTGKREREQARGMTEQEFLRRGRNGGRI